ncbi:MAG TPA: hypothetical protein VMU88_00545, partial [bacterium]|nr:hypothetical protein [bacterium]
VVLGAGASRAALPDGDKWGRKIPLMTDLIRVLNLEGLFKRYDLENGLDNFESVFSSISKNEKYSKLVAEVEIAIQDYFSSLSLPDEVTLYDYLVLMFRNKDAIITFNWDPFLSQAFQRNSEVVGYEQMPQIHFLHGNVSIGVCSECRVKGWRFMTCNKCNKRLEPVRLLYPVDQKDYTKDPFIESEWKCFQFYIQHAYFFTIFGYSAPQTDVEARNKMLEMWENNSVHDFSQLDLIDIKPEKEVKKNWKDFIVRDNFSLVNNFLESYVSHHPRRSCDAFGMATLQQNPWKENPIPKKLTLKELRDWVKPLVEEEKKGKFSGSPCSKAQ